VSDKQKAPATIAKAASTKKAAPKKRTLPGKKAVAKRAVAKGASYACHVCGLVLVVDEECGCAEVCDIICCGTPMKERKVKIRTAAKA
jgi:hypothetical protein